MSESAHASGEIEITAADREAAESIEWVQTTIDDHFLISQTFAKHRIQARNAALEEAAQLALGYADMCDGSDSQLDVGAMHAAAAIAECLRYLRTLTTTTTKGEADDAQA